MDKTLLNFLQKNEINFIENSHPAAFTVEESKKIRQGIPGLHCKCLFLKDNNGMFYLVAMPAEKRLNTNSLRKELGVQKLHFASPEELKENLNLTPGSVSIFGMVNADPKKVTLVIEETVWNAETTGFHPNINTSTLEITHESLERFCNSLNSNKLIFKNG